MWKSCHKIARAASHRKGAPWPKRYSSDIARQFRLFCGSVGSSVGSGRPSSERALLARSALLDPADAPHPLRRPVVDRRALGLAMCGRATSVARRNGAAASGLPSTDIEGRVRSDRRRALSAPLKSKPLAYRAQPVACPGAQLGHGDRRARPAPPDVAGAERNDPHTRQRCAASAANTALTRRSRPRRPRWVWRPKRRAAPWCGPRGASLGARPGSPPCATRNRSRPSAPLCANCGAMERETTVHVFHTRRLSPVNSRLQKLPPWKKSPIGSGWSLACSAMACSRYASACPVGR